MSTPPPPPFRTTLRSATAAELETSGALPEGEERIEMELRGHRSHEHILRWLAHPDERVPLHFLHALEDEPDLCASCELREQEMVNQLLARTRKEGMLWTPLLDHLARSGYWPERADAGHEQSPETAHGLWLEEMAEYLEREEDPEVLGTLLTFQTPALLRRVLAHARVLDSALVLEWSERWENLPALAANPRLSERQRALVFLRAFEGARKTNSAARQALDLLSDQGYEIPDALFARLFREPRDSTRIPEQGPNPLHPLQQQLLGYGPLTASQLGEVVETMDRRGGGMLWSPVVEHRFATREHWMGALEHAPQHASVLLGLARQEEARRDPEIRSRLLAATRQQGATGQVEVLMAMSADLSREEIEPLLNALLGQNRQPQAVQWLGRGEFPDWMSAGELAPFCQSPLAPVRLAAIQALSRLEGRSQSSGPEQKTPAAQSAPRR